MKSVVQRVSKASVSINNQLKSEIERGILILLGIEEKDSLKEMEWMCDKLLKLRIFEDSDGKMNKSVQDIEGELMVISQFTLYGDCRKGTRPSFIKAARPNVAIPMYEAFIERLKTQTDLKIETGEFGANMQVDLVNDGPVTLILEKENNS